MGTGDRQQNSGAMTSCNRRLWAWWAVSRAAALCLGWLAAQEHRGNVFFDIRYYQSWSDGALSGDRVPYRDFGWEYPPGALPSMALPGVVAAGLSATALHGISHAIVFGAVWVAFMLIVDAIVMRRLLASSEPAGRLWLSGLPLLGALSWARYDLLPAGAAVGAIIAAGSGHARRSGLLASLGGSLKIWPALLSPMQATREGAKRATFTSAVSLALVAAITVGVTGRTGFGQVLSYQTRRGLQVESLPALPLLWLRHLHVIEYTASFRYGAWELSGPGTRVAALLATATYVLGLAGLGAVLRKTLRRGDGVTTITTGAVAFVVITLATDKVFSPQYVLWLLAAVAAACAVDPVSWTPLLRWVLAIAALTAVVFPWAYGDVLGDRGWWGVVALTARDAVLVVLAVCVARRLKVLSRQAPGLEPLVASPGAEAE
ncbi:MAG: hypothetical protein JWO12_2860 [Frankiales bacterium]|nr:hypothetical protein [Frankiales bacterium]